MKYCLDTIIMHWHFATSTIWIVIICRELNDPTYYCIAAKRKYISNSDSTTQKTAWRKHAKSISIYWIISACMNVFILFDHRIALDENYMEFSSVIWIENAMLFNTVLCRTARWCPLLLSQIPKWEVWLYGSCQTMYQILYIVYHPVSRTTYSITR